MVLTKNVKRSPSAGFQNDTAQGVDAEGPKDSSQPVRQKREDKDHSLKRLQGIVIPFEPVRYKDKLAILTPKGNLIPIIKNSKLSLLGNLLWESVSVIGRLHVRRNRPFLEVIYFSIDDKYEPEWSDDSNENAIDLVNHVDYESFNF